MASHRPKKDGSMPINAVGVLAGLAALLGVINIFLARGNASIEAEVQRRQQAINQAIALSPLNVQLSEMIGTLVQSTGDIDMRAVLETHGINIDPEADGAGR